MMISAAPFLWLCREARNSHSMITKMLSMNMKFFSSLALFANIRKWLGGKQLFYSCEDHYKHFRLWSVIDISTWYEWSWFSHNAFLEFTMNSLNDELQRGNNSNSWILDVAAEGDKMSAVVEVPNQSKMSIFNSTFFCDAKSRWKVETSKLTQTKEKPRKK